MDEETTALRERIVSTRRKVHKVTIAAVAARWNFEEGVGSHMQYFYLIFKNRQKNSFLIFFSVLLDQTAILPRQTPRKVSVEKLERIFRL